MNMHRDGIGETIESFFRADLVSEITFLESHSKGMRVAKVKTLSRLSSSTEHSVKKSIQSIS